MVDPATWSDADRRHLEELSRHASTIRQTLPSTARRALASEHSLPKKKSGRPSDRCTPHNVAHTCIYGFAIQAFQRYGMDKDAYALIDQGFLAFRPHDGDDLIDRSNRSWQLTSNAKFDRFRTCIVRPDPD